MAEDGEPKIMDEAERKRLISEVSRMKDILDSFKYGLNFEEFAEALFKTVDRQTIAIKKLDEKMANILSRMESMEKRIDEGIKVRVTSLSAEGRSTLSSGEEVVIEEPLDTAPESSDTGSLERSELEREAAELETKIARLFEKENEHTEMVLNDPASADEHEERARVAREMRIELEASLRDIKAQLKKM